MFKPIQRVLRLLAKDEQGGIVIMFALMINILILIVALSLDIGRGYMGRAAIAGAADSAALCSAINGGDAAKAQGCFEANLPSGSMSITYDYATDVSHVIDPSTGTVSVSTSSFQMPTYFTGSLGAGGGAGNLNVGGKTVVGIAAQAATAPADVYFILDTSGSMNSFDSFGGSRIGALKLAVQSFLTTVFATDPLPDAPDGLPFYRISFTNYSTTGVGGDTPVTSGPIQSHDVSSNSTQLNSIVNGLFASGLTCGGCGLRDSYDRITTATAQLVGAGSTRRQIAIFMTDGEFNQVGQANRIPNGFSASWPSNYTGIQQASAPHRYVANMCDQIIGEFSNVSMWTIRFGAGSNAGLNRSVMDYCASSIDQSTYAADGNALNGILSNIANVTTRVRVLE